MAGADKVACHGRRGIGGLRGARPRCQSLRRSGKQRPEVGRGAFWCVIFAQNVCIGKRFFMGVWGWGLAHGWGWGRVFGMIRPLWLVGCLVLWPWVGQAQQTDFVSSVRGDWAEFAFAWRDAEGQPQQLKFALPLDDVRLGAREFGKINQTNEQAFVLARMQDYAQQHSVGGTRVTVTRQGDTFLIATEGPDGAALQQHAAALSDMQLQAQQDYLKQHYYQPDAAAGVPHAYKPDYPALAARYTPALAPLIAAIGVQTAGQPPRAVVNYVMNFLQSIPYDTLQDSQTSNGAGFQTPHGLLARNLGDCDTKSVALAAILRGLYPALPMVMVMTADHALLAVGLPQGGNDYALQLPDGVFVLADATGPGLYPLGSIGDDTRAQLAGKVAQYQRIR